MRRLSVCLGLVAIFALAPRAEAQTPPVLANYSAGWNMVAGPTGTDFSPADFVQQYTSNGYVDVTNRIVSACQGYWAWFTNPTVVTLPSTATGPTQNCVLQPGWNILGNPFAGVAVLPSYVKAWRYNPDIHTYQFVSTIPPGGAVWVQSDGVQTITLQFQGVVTPAPQTLVLSDLVKTGPFTVHVGDHIKLQLPSGAPHIAVATPTQLSLESSGSQGDLSCTNNSCTPATLVNQFWIWKAIAPGTGFIDVTPVGGSPTTEITVDILP